MKKTRVSLAILVLSLLCSTSSFAAEMKEWTLLVFLSGNNDLDANAALNVAQMTEIGSSDQVNMVVQWASLSAKKTKRIFVKKGSYDVIEESNPIDMGDYHQLVEFVRWAQIKYPAKKYMIDIWSHGSGWHVTNDSKLHLNDISYDDNTGHQITTEELGQAMREIAKLIGHKIELYASDACMMAMGEVAAEMTDSVSYFAGSQENIPGTGWPYAKFLAPLVAKPTMDGGELAKILSHEYIAAYSAGGIYENRSVTFSVYDLSKISAFYGSVKNVVQELKSMDKVAMRQAFDTIETTQRYSWYEYKDFIDYLDRVSNTTGKISAITLNGVRSTFSDLVIANDVSPSYVRSHGMSVWLPDCTGCNYDDYKVRYQAMVFAKHTGWGDFLAAVMGAQP